jgi:hypothetical protein
VKIDPSADGSRNAVSFHFANNYSILAPERSIEEISKKYRRNTGEIAKKSGGRPAKKAKNPAEEA